MTEPPVPAPGDAPVVVAGAGPTGVAVAILLAQHDVPVLILERRVGVHPLPRAVHLDDEVHRIVQQLGIGAEFSRISRPGTGMRLLDARHRVLAKFPRPATGPHGYPQANMFDQPDLERLLRAHLAGHHPEVAFHEGVEVVAVHPDVDGLLVRVRCRGRDGVQELAASAVLGCDGANGLSREAIGSTWTDLRFEETWLVVDGRCPHPLPGGRGVDQICDPARAATFMRIGETRYRWEFRVHPHEDAEALSARPRLDALLAPWIADVPAGDLDVLRSSGYVFRARVADRWRHERVFLLGDAAHLTPPFIGQGLGAGLRDASNLAWKLARVLSGASPEALLDSYQDERRRHVVQQIRLARTVGWALTGGGGAGAAARGAVSRTVLRVPWLTPRVLDRTSPPLRGGALTRSRRRSGPRSLVGTLAPQPRIADAGHARPLDEVLGTRPTILTRSEPDAPMLALAARIGAQVLRTVPRGEAARARRTTSGIAGTRTLDDGGTLEDWLAGAGATAAVLRPDRVVLAVAASSSDPGRELARTRACSPLERPRRRCGGP